MEKIILIISLTLNFILLVGIVALSLGRERLEKMANAINGKTKTRYIFDFVVVATILIYSFTTDYSEYVLNVGGFEIPYGKITPFLAAFSFAFTRMIHRKQNSGNILSIFSNMASGLLDTLAGELYKLFDFIPNLMFSIACAFSGHGKIEKFKFRDIMKQLRKSDGINDMHDGEKKKLTLVLVFTTLLTITLAYWLTPVLSEMCNITLKTPKNGGVLTVMFVVHMGVIRNIIKNGAYGLQIWRKGFATQIMFFIYSIYSTIYNALLGKVPSVIKGLGYIPSSGLSIFTWKEKRDN